MRLNVRRRGGRLFRVMLLSGLAWLGCNRTEEVAPPEPPAPPPPLSIVFIMIDTLRADHLGSYGFKAPVSPNLDQIAREGIVFDRCFSVAPWTKPAIASLFTGLDPSIHKVLTHAGRYSGAAKPVRPRKLATDALPASAVTVAEQLKEQNYATAAFIANPWITRTNGFAQGFDVFDIRFASNDTPADHILPRVTTWMQRRKEERPFFLYLHFMDVHDPYDAPDEDVDAIRDADAFGSDRQLAEEELPRSMVRHMRNLRLGWTKGPNSHSLREWRVRYAAGVRAFDRRIGAFLDELRSTGWMDRVVLIITSDHGEELFEHEGWSHGHSLHEHQLYVPLIVRMPNAEHAGTRIDDLVSIVDLAPTIAGLAGTALPGELSGVDLSPRLRGSVDVPMHAAVFAAGVKSKPELHGVRSPSHKLIQDMANGTSNLFDLREDPGERHDIAAKSPRITFELSEILERHLSDAAKHPGVGRAQAEIPAEDEERLRALGYLQ